AVRTPQLPKPPELAAYEDQARTKLNNPQPEVPSNPEELAESLLIYLHERAQDLPPGFSNYSSLVQATLEQIGFDSAALPLEPKAKTNVLRYKGNPPELALKLMDGIYEITGAVPIASSFQDDEKRSISPHMLETPTGIMVGSEDPLRFAGRLWAGSWRSKTVFFYETLWQSASKKDEKPYRELRWQSLDNQGANQALDEIVRQLWLGSETLQAEIENLPQPPTKRQKTAYTIRRVLNKVAYPKGKPDLL
ncbi:MAG: hypothetical protein AAB896_01425, partial [Patescibacteria group bacterium]